MGYLKHFEEIGLRGKPVRVLHQKDVNGDSMKVKGEVEGRAVHLNVKTGGVDWGVARGGGLPARGGGRCVGDVGGGFLFTTSFWVGVKGWRVAAKE